MAVYWVVPAILVLIQRNPGTAVFVDRLFEKTKKLRASFTSQQIHRLERA